MEAEDTKKRIHPTQKPSSLFKWIYEKYTKVNNVIADPYCGGGSSLVACQNLNRKCRAIELSPDYCAVILQRMKDAFPNIEIKRHE